MEIHIKKGQQQFGPYSRQQIKSFLSVGFIQLSYLSSLDGVNNWVQLASREEFGNAIEQKAVETTQAEVSPASEQKKTARGN